MEATNTDNQPREIEAIKRVVAAVQHATQNEPVEEFIDLFLMVKVARRWLAG